MAGIDFDRKAFVPATESAPSSQNRALGSLILLIALFGLGFLGYKFISDSKQSAAAASDSQSLEGLQQQLAKLEKRLDQIERRRKAAAQESDLPSANAAARTPMEKSSPKKTMYMVVPPSGVKASTPPVNQTAPVRVTPAAGAATEDPTADREAWQATTDRLADVVGVVGSQEGEISQTRDQVNALLAQTRRSAVPFELRRGAARQSVGPVSIVLKASDPKNQRYTVCVYLEDKCVELRDRTVDEVVVFVASRNSTPLGLVTTRVLRDRIVGYLEVPDKVTP
jgi:cell division protein FtsB